MSEFDQRGAYHPDVMREELASLTRSLDYQLRRAEAAEAALADAQDALRQWEASVGGVISLPPLTARSVKRYIAAVAHAVAAGVLPKQTASPLLYAAQLMLSARRQQ